MTDDQDMIPYWDKEPEKAGALSDQLGRFIFEFSDLEGTLAYDVATLLTRSRSASDDAFVINDVLTFGAKVHLFDGICRMRGHERIADYMNREYLLNDVVSLLKGIGASRNRFMHDEMWSSSSFGSARVVQLSKKGNPYGEGDGWLGDIYPETVQVARDELKKGKDALVKFMLALDWTLKQKDSTDSEEQ